MSQCRAPKRTSRVSDPMAPTTTVTPESDDPVVVLQRAVIGTRFRQSAAMAALLAELAFSNPDDRRR